MYSKELLKGTLTTIILNLLKDRGRMYGYEITQAVKEKSTGKILIREGSLYPALHKMLADGLLSTHEENIGKRIRVYYDLTEKGKAELVLRNDELFSFFDTIKSILLPESKIYA
ncbi:MAG: PadR family transcriptional regulator [Bacteroidia bacterium]